MQIVKTPVVLRQIIKQWRQKHKRIVLIPTMGNLHEGHMTLVDIGKLNADKVITSIFINPMQFDQSKDFTDYPRTFKKDCKKLIQHDVDILFSPTSTIMYPGNISHQTFVDVPRFANILEGLVRPGHFRGVATIISKLFNIIQPDVACFGRKDFQQLMLIRQIVYDMNYNIKIIDVPIIRNTDGLALSSRNNFLTEKERHLAPQLYIIMQHLIAKINNGERQIDCLLKTAENQLLHAGLKPDQLSVCDAHTLQSLTIDSQQAIVLFSAWLGKTRLIDNAQVSLSN